MWGLGLTREDLMELGLLIGADVPFCILGGAALARELRKVEEIKSLQNTWFVLAKPQYLYPADKYIVYGFVQNKE